MSSNYRGQIHRFFLPSPPSIGESFSFVDENLAIAKVLRLRAGDEVVLIDGKGLFAVAKILTISKKKAECVVLRSELSDPPNFHATLIQGIPKMDRAEWIIQKCTELGAHEIQFVQTEHAVAIKKNSILDRWNKIALEACRQSGQVFLPKISLYPNLDAALETTSIFDLNILCNEYEKEVSFLSTLQTSSRPKRNFRLAVGPEGGWSQKELQKFQEKSFKSVYLSKNILRVETASIVSLAIATSFMLES